MSAGDVPSTSSSTGGGMSCKWVVHKVDGDLMDSECGLVKVIKDIASNIRYQRTIIVCDSRIPPLSVQRANATRVAPTPVLPPPPSDAPQSDIQPLRIRKKSTSRRPLKLSPDATIYEEIAAIEEMVSSVAKSSIFDAIILEEVGRQIQDDCDSIGRLVASSKFQSQTTASALKYLLKTLSQRLTSKVVTAVLLDQGIEAEHVVIVKDALQAATCCQELSIVNQKDISALLLPQIKPFKSTVLVTSGSSFDVSGPLSPDHLASFLSIALHAKELQVWTKFKGLYTADPGKVPSARLVPFISPAEAAELSKQGHPLLPKSMLDQLVAYGISIRMRSLTQPQNYGTVIDPALRFPELDISAPSSTTLGDLPPTAITIKDGILMFSIKSPRAGRSSPAFLSGVCGILSKFGVVVTMINTSERHASVAIEAGLPKNIFDKVVAGLRTHGKVSVYHDMSILTIVGRELCSTSGTAGRVFSTLSKALVNVEMIGRLIDVASRAARQV
ncbi:hypothetical protein ONZ45_g9563 [Pleurotus djamor]|nr:hypothetical protein ONZ45_g9563 [Pleurotus djamor]